MNRKKFNHFNARNYVILVMVIWHRWGLALCEKYMKILIRYHKKRKIFYVSSSRSKLSTSSWGWTLRKITLRASSAVLKEFSTSRHPRRSRIFPSKIRSQAWRSLPAQASLTTSVSQEERIWVISEGGGEGGGSGYECKRQILRKIMLGSKCEATECNWQVDHRSSLMWSI